MANKKIAKKKLVKKTKSKSRKTKSKTKTPRKLVAGAAESKPSESLPPLDLKAFSPILFIEKLERAYKTTLAKPYADFIRELKFEKYRRMELSGYIRGPYFLNFIDEALQNVTDLGMESGITDIDDCNWKEDYADYMPLASLSHPELNEGSKCFLVMNIRDSKNPVLLFDYQGWKLYPIAESFENFLRDLPNAKNQISTSFRPSDKVENEGSI